MEGRAVPTAIAGGMEEATNMGRKAATNQHGNQNHHRPTGKGGSKGNAFGMEGVTSMVIKTSTGTPIFSADKSDSQGCGAALGMEGER
jgi:hypothetical protein